MTSFPEGLGRNKALAFWGGIGGLGATAALLIGGALTDAIGWRSIFLLNLPVAAAMLALAPVLLCESRDRARGRHLDVTGPLTVTGALALLVVAFVRVPDVGWTGPSTIATLLVAAGLGVAFVAAERRSVAPFVPLRVFGSRSLVAGNLVMLLAAMTAVGMSLTRSLYAQDLLGYSPLKFGLATTAMTTMTLVGSFAAEALVGRLGLWPIAAASMICLGAGSLALTQISPHGSYVGDLLPGLLLFGPGLGATTVIASIAALGGIAEQEAGAASGTNTAAFQIGGATGAAIVTTVAATQGNGTAAALTDGYQMAFAACAGFAIIGLTAAFLLKTRCATRAIAAPEKLSEPPPERACSPSAGLSRPSLTQETAPCSVTIPSTSSSRSAT